MQILSDVSRGGLVVRNGLTKKKIQIDSPKLIRFTKAGTRQDFTSNRNYDQNFSSLKLYIISQCLTSLFPVRLIVLRGR